MKSSMEYLSFTLRFVADLAPKTDFFVCDSYKPALCDGWPSGIAARVSQKVLLRCEVMDVNIPPAFVLCHQECFEGCVAPLHCEHVRCQSGSEIGDDRKPPHMHQRAFIEGQIRYPVPPSDSFNPPADTKTWRCALNVRWRPKVWGTPINSTRTPYFVFNHS